jgi:P-type Ca2+ transporter type 2C
VGQLRVAAELRHLAFEPMSEPWHSRSAEEVLAQLGSATGGLTAQRAAERLAADGPNELKEGPALSPWPILLSQFKSLIVWLLIAAGGLALFLGDGADALAILAIVVLNAAIGFYQEFKAEKAIAALQQMTAPQAKVRRDGQVISIPAAGIVAGDVLVLEAGDLVAADARLMEAASLRCIESALTGEAEASSKQPDVLAGDDIPLGDRHNLVFMGTSVAAGTGLAVVVATAMQTELGRIAGMLAEADPDPATPLQRKLDGVGRILIWAALGIVALLFGLGLLRGTPPLELFTTSISLAVAAVPEGLPAVVTVALSLGVRRMARRRALMRKLAAVEALGSASVICTDKTGTLTAGAMTVRELFVAGESYQVTGEGYGSEGAVLTGGQKAEAAQMAPLRELAAVLLGANSARLEQVDGASRAIGDPTEGALLVAGIKAGGDLAQIEREWPRQQELPFDSDRKRGTIIRQMPGGIRRAFVNGAPGPLLQQCTRQYTSAGVQPLTDPDREHILAQTSLMAKKALRVLASAYGDLGGLGAGPLTADAVERDLVFVGLSGMYDPPRPEAKEAIVQCRAAGIRVVMITGDHPQTASAIAGELGLPASDVAISGVELDKMSAEELQRRVPEIGVFARVTAEHKLRIVRAWKANNAIVAMTGDGVNDAPAIKGADIGIAMGKSGTEVTKQAADMIITDDNFATIVAAVEEGRGVYHNIRKTLQYLLAGNTGELMLMTAAVAVGLPAPLLPIHLLWINLVTDGLPALCLATDSVDTGLMLRQPRPRSEGLTDRGFLPAMLFTGFLTAAVAFAVFIYTLQTGTLETARASAFATLVFAELLRSFGARSESKPLWRIPVFTNVSLLAVVLASIGIQFWSQHNDTLGRFLRTPAIPFAHGFVLLAAGFTPLLVLEVAKVIRLQWTPTEEIKPK